MKYSFTSVSLLALAHGSAVTLSAAVPSAQSPKTSHIINIHRDMNKYNTALARQRSLKRDATESGLNYNGAYWFAQGTAGGQNIEVTLDTGSADLWLVDPSAGADATAGVQTWDPTTTSDTAQMSGYSFTVSYGQGGNGVSGAVYSSPVCLGSACTTMAVGSATHDQGMGTIFRSGIMGLGFQGFNSFTPNKQPTFVESLAPSLSQPIMVTKFSTAAGASQIAFGDIPFNYQGPFQEASVAQSAYPNTWSYAGVQYEVDGENIGSFDIVFDTGCPNTTGDEATVRAYYAKVAGAVDLHGDATSWTVPCGTQLPDLRINLGSAYILLPGEKLYNGNTATTGQCAVYFVRDSSTTRGCVGDPFFEQHVVVYNYGAQTIQWANQV